MYKNIQILIFIFASLVNLIQITFGNYCETNSKITQAFNLGKNVYLGQHSKSIWKFDSDVRQIIDQKLDIKSLFGENSFDWADTAFTFVFDECNPLIKGQSYCEAIDSAKDLVIVIGRRKEVSSDPTDTRKYGYSAFRVNGEDLIPVYDNGDYVAWNLKGKGSLWSSFWVQLSGDLYYESSVFIKSRNELIVSVFDTSSFSDSVYHLMSRKLENNGEWSDKWTDIASIGFRGMFELNDRVFGFDKKNSVLEFKWSDDNTIYFEPISDIKELFNCFGNSSLMNGMQIPNTSITITTTTTTTTTTERTSLPTISLNNSVADYSTTEGSVASHKNPSENEIIHEISSYQTILPEFEFITNITESTTQFESQPNQRLEESPEALSEETTDWSTVFVVAILLLIIVIIIALGIFIRNKSKSRIVYMNSKSDESKSAEIPLNNNNDKSVHTKDV